MPPIHSLDDLQYFSQPNDQTTFTSASCPPSFANPCAINYIYHWLKGHFDSVEHRQIQGLFAD